MVNRERARRIMERLDLDVLIATAPENVAYTTGFEPVLIPRINWLQRYWAVLPSDPSKDVVLIVPRISLVYLIQTPLPGVRIKTVGDYYFSMNPDDPLAAEEIALLELRERVQTYSSAMDALSAALSDLDVRHRKAGIGVDETLFSAREWGELQRALPDARVTEAYGTFREIRMVKTPDEVERLRRVAEINERAMLRAMELVREGVEHRQVHERLRQEMVLAGGTPTAVTVGFSWQSNYAFTAPSDYKAKRGDVFNFDCGCRVDGYASDTARTGVIGPPTPRQEFHYQVVREAQQVGLDMLKPGVRACDVFHAMLNVFHSAHKSTAFQRHSFGHGIGRSTYDAPNISPDDETPLEVGMVLNIEAPDRNLGFGGLTIEDTVLLTENGYEFLTHADRELYIR